ncbi:MAG TPA: hypothetical protein DEO88_02100, partial [Syntrophobacteraceae bacterium]|nr:hypothetical protein [Syntrophobacteraceae bacterium]
MILDLQSGHFLFEAVLGYQVGEETNYTIPYLVQADDANEAEERIWGCLEEHGVGDDFWIEELSDPYEIR